MMGLAIDVVAKRVAALRTESAAIATEIADGYRSGEITPFVEEVLATALKPMLTHPGVATISA